jgi:hypothetical protein
VGTASECGGEAEEAAVHCCDIVGLFVRLWWRWVGSD